MTGKKFDNEKPMVALVPPTALLEVAKVMTYGATKYGTYNWLGGLKYTRLASASMRHMLAWLAGEDKDPETGISHVAHAACNMLMLLEFEATKRTELDDRYKNDT